MHSFFSQFLASIETIPWVAIVAIIGSFVMGPVIIFIVFQSIQRRHQLWHETARVALEKGQPLPPMPADVAPPPPTETKPTNDIRTGLILIATGGGLFLFLNTLVGRGLGFVGAIPGFIGVALLLFGILNAILTTRRNRTPSDRS